MVHAETPGAEASPQAPDLRRTLRIVAFAGSLRHASMNRGLLRAAAQLAPPNVKVEPFDLREIPLYDEDLRLAGPPPAVVELKRRVAEADGLLIATPEYNHSFSAVTKNAIDWISRPPSESPLRELPVAVLGVSDGHFGTTRAQYHLRQVLTATRSNVMSSPSLFVFYGRDHTDEAGDLVDPELRERLRTFMAAFATWIRRLQSEPEHE